MRRCCITREGWDRGRPACPPACPLACVPPPGLPACLPPFLPPPSSRPPVHPSPPTPHLHAPTSCCPLFRRQQERAEEQAAVEGGSEDAAAASVVSVPASSSAPLEPMGSPVHTPHTRVSPFGSAFAATAGGWVGGWCSAGGRAPVVGLRRASCVRPTTSCVLFRAVHAVRACLSVGRWADTKALPIT